MDQVTSWVTAHAVFLIPLVTMIISAFFRAPSAAAIAEATGVVRIALIIWSDLVTLAGILGVNGPLLLAWVKLRFFTPKPPKGPPPLPPAPTTNDSSMNIILDEDTDPNVPAFPHSAPPPAAPIAAKKATLLFGSYGGVPGAFAMTAFLYIATVCASCAAFDSDVQAYTPTASDELVFGSTAAQEEACRFLDAGKADRLSCLHDVECEHGVAEAGTCDGGTSAGELLTACLHDGGAYVCTSSAVCVCRAKSDAAAEAGGGK